MCGVVWWDASIQVAFDSRIGDLCRGLRGIDLDFGLQRGIAYAGSDFSSHAHRDAHSRSDVDIDVERDSGAGSDVDVDASTYPHADNDVNPDIDSTTDTNGDTRAHRNADRDEHS